MRRPTTFTSIANELTADGAPSKGKTDPKSPAGDKDAMEGEWAVDGKGKAHGKILNPPSLHDNPHHGSIIPRAAASTDVTSPPDKITAGEEIEPVQRNVSGSTNVSIQMLSF